MRRLIFVLVAAALFAFGTVSCGKSEKQKREESAARVLGRAQALELSAGLPLDTIEIEKLLIDVRSREAELRRRGYGSVADVYVAAFLAALDSVNPSLSAEIR